MARFAALCLLKCAHVCHHLAPVLGEETADLGLRVGIHSGSVTVSAERSLVRHETFLLLSNTVLPCFPLY